MYQHITRWCSCWQSLLKQNLLLPLCISNVGGLRTFVFRRMTGENHQSWTLVLHRVHSPPNAVSVQFCRGHKIEVARLGPEQRRCRAGCCSWPERVHLHELLEIMNVPRNVAMCRTPFRPRMREQWLHKSIVPKRRRSNTVILTFGK